MGRRPRKSKSEWQVRLDEQSSSDETVVQFCKSRGLSTTAFRYQHIAIWQAIDYPYGSFCYCYHLPKAVYAILEKNRNHGVLIWGALKGRYRNYSRSNKVR